MIVVNIKGDISKVLNALNDLEKTQVPFATVVALTKTAQFAQGELVKEMSKVFDRPTPFTLNSLYVKSATKASPTAQVRMKDEAFKGNPAVRWLFPEIEGGGRNPKGFEALLIRAGILQSGWYAIPTSNAPLDAYGNVPASTIKQILSQLQSARDSQMNESASNREKRNRLRTRGRYFAVLAGATRGGLKPGIYERLGSAWGSGVRPIFIFTSRRPTYSRRFAFYQVGQDAAKARFPIEFGIAIKQAVATAR